MVLHLHMHKNIFSSLFKKQKKQEKDAVLTKMYSLRQQSNFFIYDAVEIFHHKQKYKLPLIMYDEHRGLYLFEIKEWSYDELKNATITQTQKAQSAQNTLSYNSMQETIKKKLDEIIHTSEIPIYNYLIMNNLSSREYKSLDHSLKEYLPKNRIIFHDTNEEEILKKLYAVETSNDSFGDPIKILGSLLTQYTIIDKENELYLVNEEQKGFIDAPLKNFTNIHALAKSGVSTTLLLKALFELLNNPALHITIIKPTRVAKDMLHRQLLEMIEHAIVSLDIFHIQIVTPQELQEKSAQKEFLTADIVFCDDAQLMPKEFLSMLKNVRKNKTLILSNDTTTDATLSFSTSYLPQTQNVFFYQTNVQAKALQLTAKILKNFQAKELLLISNKLTQTKLQEDLEFFVKEKVNSFKSEVALTFQELDALQLATYKDINELQYEDAILLNIEDASKEELEYAILHAKNCIHILYENESPRIQELKEKYESN